MLNQEEIYQLIFKEKWNDLLDLLYEYKQTISTDVLLSAASKVIETEFFNKVNGYPQDDMNVVVVLETFYQLNHAKYYTISEDHYKQLFDELAVRKPDSYGHKLNKTSVQNDVNKRTVESNVFSPASDPLPNKWTEIYNRLFELINVEGDAATYFSGRRFIDVIRLFSPYHPDYNQYIDERNRLGKSTTRKIYYFDILRELSFEVRKNTIDTILDIVRPHDSYRVGEIEFLLYNKIKDVETAEARITKKPIVFISYSWDSPEHKKWVLNLANRLGSDEIEVILDRQVLRAGSNMPYFIEQSISKADKVLIIFTPNYKLKADQRAGGVGYEYSIVNAALYKNQIVNEKIIPILRKGSQVDSIPDFMHQYIHIDITNDENFKNSYGDLKREIRNEAALLD